MESKFVSSIRFMILSTLSFALMNALVKYLISYHTFQLVFFRSLGSLILTFSILKSKNIPLLGNQKTLLLIRGLVGVSAMILFFLGIQSIGVASSVTLRYTSPIFAAILAVIFFKEKIKIPQWTFFILAFFGVYLIKSFQPLSSSIGVLLVLGAAFLSAIVYLIISKIGDNDHPVTIVHYFMFIATLVGGIGSIFFWKTPELKELLLLISLGFFGFFGQYYMTLAFQNYKPHLVAPFKYVEVFFTFTMSIFLLDEAYDLVQILGAVLIIVALLLNIWYKFRFK